MVVSAHYKSLLLLLLLLFRLATVVSSNPINFVNADCYDWGSGIKNAH